MQFIILRKIQPATNQETFACVRADKVDVMLADDWTFFLTRETMGYEDEATAWLAFSNHKSAAQLFSGRGGKLPSQKNA